MRLEAYAVVAALALAGCSEPRRGSGARSAGDEDVTFPDEAAAAEASARHPATPTVRAGEEALAAGRVEEAEGLFRQAVAEDPADPRAQLDLGLVLELRNDYDGAEAAYRAALALDPAFPQGLNNLGLLLRDRDRPAESVPLLRRAVEEDPTFGEAWLNLALALEESGDDVGARQAYARAVRLRRDDATARANFGLLLLRLGERDQAALELRRALSLARGDAAALQAIGNGLRRAGQPEAAVRALELAIEARGEPTPALLSELALAHRANGDRAAAKAALEQALRLDEGYATAHTLLGSLLAAEGDYPAAIRHFERYLALEPNGPQAERTRRKLEMARRAAR